MGRMPGFGYWMVTGAMLLAMGSFRPVRAQDQDDLKRGVARISLMDGDVSVRRGDSGDWVAGVVNAPLMSDDYISTGANSRTEVQFDDANMLRLGANAQLRLTQLEDGHYQMELAHGTVSYRVLRPTSANVEVDTPSIAIRPSKQGVYRIAVSESEETQVTVRAGEVEVFTPRGDQWVSTGQTLLARGAAADAEFQIVQAGPADDWDRWNDTRDRALLQSTSPQYVGPGVAGTEDLDNNGDWSYDPNYGNVWIPQVAPGWAPYQCGRWVWEDWYGWTWVGCESWGWAPYHYGRWYWRTGFGWGWYPGAFGGRRYWSPALVGFFGFGSGVGFGVGFGFGHIGWCPLAPFEVFHPWWGRGVGGRGLAISNVNVAGTFRNARVANGITAVNAADFRAGRFTGAMHTSGAQVGAAGLVQGRMPMAPSNANLRFTDRAAASVPRTSGNTQFFTHQQPGPSQRTPFGQQQRGLESAGARTGAAGAAAGGMSRPAAGAGAGSSGAAGGWRRFGDSPAQSPGSVNRGGAGASPSLQNSRPSGVNNSIGAGRSAAPGGPQSVRIAPPVARERTPNAPSYNAPRSAPAPSYNAPRSAPSYSAPRSSGGGGGGHPSGGSGGHSGGGGHGHR